MNPVMSTRRNDIDWLRIFAAYLLFVFSIARVLDGEPFYHIRDIEISSPLSYVTFFMYQWHLPLFFLLAGWSRRTSLQMRFGMDSFKERTLRLMVPFITGCVLICPLLTYAELTGGRSAGLAGYERPGISGGYSLIEFLPDFFTRSANFSWVHLWFLIYLFLFTLLSWPFFTWLLKRKIMPLKMGVSSVYLPVIPLSLMQLAMAGQWPGSGALVHDWGDFPYFFFYFLMGFLISRYSAYERVIHQEYRRAGILGTGLFAVLAVSASELTMPSIRMAASAAGWCCMVWLLGFAKEHLEQVTRGLSYLRESSLPVYILHPVPVVFLGYFIIDDLHAGVMMKIITLLFMSVSSTLVVYHLLIRRIPALRWIFGMKPRQGVGESWKDQASSRV